MAKQIPDGANIDTAFQEVSRKEWRSVWQVARLAKPDFRTARLDCRAMESSWR